MVSKNTLIACGLRNINKTIMSMDDLLEYINELCNKLKQNKIRFYRININDIKTFCNYYSYILSFDGHDKAITFKDREKGVKFLEKYFLSNLSESIESLLKEEELFILPLCVGDSINLYSFKSNNDYLMELKDRFYRDEEHNSYVIDVTLIKNKDDFVDNILLKSNNIKKRVVSINSIREFTHKSSNLFVDGIRLSFHLKNLDEELNNSISKVNKYLALAYENEMFLSSSSKEKILEERIYNGENKR